MEIEDLRLTLMGFSTAFGWPRAPRPEAHDALVSLYLRIASLASAALLACEHAEYYAARALTRCISEHWMRFMTVAAGIAPHEFFREFKEAEEIDIDRRLRNCFENGEMPADLSGQLRGLLESTLRNPKPTDQQREKAREILRGYEFDKLSRGLLKFLKRGDGLDTPDARLSMAIAYAKFSACVHGGPVGHDYLTSAPSAEATFGTALDIISAWMTALTMTLGKVRGREDALTVRALELQAGILNRPLGVRMPGAP